MGFNNLLDILGVTLAISLAICFIRLYLGPDVPNRTVAFDTIAVHAVGLIAIYSVRLDSSALVDAATITAVLGFLGTTMMARYLERSGRRYIEIKPKENLEKPDLRPE